MSDPIVNLEFKVRASTSSLKYTLCQILTVDGKEETAEITNSMDRTMMEFLAKVLTNTFKIGLLSGRLMERTVTVEETKQLVDGLGLPSEPE